MVARRYFVAWIAAALGAGCAGRTSVPSGFSLCESYAIDPANTRARLEIDGAHRRYRAITVMVSGRALDIDRVTVEYGSEDSIEFAVAERVSAGGLTQSFSLPANYRPIRAVVVDYRAGESFRRGLVRVHVYGAR